MSSSTPTTQTATHIAQHVGATGLVIPSTLAGQNVQQSYLALKNFSPIQLNKTMPTQLPVCGSGTVMITNPLGNSLVLVGGLSGESDQPYFIPGRIGVGRGTKVMPGSTEEFQITNSSLLSAISERNGDIIEMQAMLATTNFQTPTSDPGPSSASLPGLAVTSTNPLNGATSVATNQIIQIIFNRAVAARSLSFGTNILISPNVTQMTAYIDSSNPAQLDLDPHGANLQNSDTYTVTVKSGATGVEDNFGLFLQSPYSFSFTTASNAPPPPPTPNVSSVSPGNNASGVSITTKITIVMNTPILPAGVTNSNVYLVQNSNGQTVSGTSVSVASDNVTITMTVPSAGLSYSTTYYVVVQNLQNPVPVTESPNPWYGDSRNAKAGLFTTTAQTFTLRYNVSQSSCSTNQDEEYGPITQNDQNTFSGAIGQVGNVGGCSVIATAYGETATTSNGLTIAPITKIVFPVIVGSNGDWCSGSSSFNNPPSGNVGIQIMDSSGTIKHTFSSTFTASSSGFNSQCQSNVEPATYNGWTNITLQDPNNTYTMVVGDSITVTFTGTGGNVIMVSQSTAGTYGNATYYDGSSFHNLSGQDMACTMYSSP